MPKENDWILSGLAFDTTFVRDFVSYKLSNSIGQYASRAEYCELLLNGSTRDLYAARNLKQAANCIKSR